jgi:hypothetical protein
MEFYFLSPVGAASGPDSWVPISLGGRVFPEGIPDAAPAGAARLCFYTFTHGFAVGYMTALLSKIIGSCLFGRCKKRL